VQVVKYIKFQKELDICGSPGPRSTVYTYPLANCFMVRHTCNLTGFCLVSGRYHKPCIIKLQMLVLPFLTPPGFYAYATIHL